MAPSPLPGQHSPTCFPNAAPQPRAPFPAVHHRDILGPQGHGVGGLQCGLSFPLYEAGLSQTRPQRSSSPAFPRPPDQARVLTAQLSSAPHRPPGPSPGHSSGGEGARTRACPASSFAFWIKYSCICSIKRNDRHTNSTQESSRFKATGQESADMQSVRRHNGKRASLPTATKG